MGKGNKNIKNTLNCIKNTNPWRTVQKKKGKSTRNEKENLVGKTTRGGERFPLDNENIQKATKYGKYNGKQNTKKDKQNSTHIKCMGKQRKNNFNEIKVHIKQNSVLVDEIRQSDWLKHNGKRIENKTKEDTIETTKIEKSNRFYELSITSARKPKKLS